MNSMTISNSYPYDLLYNIISQHDLRYYGPNILSNPNNFIT